MPSERPSQSWLSAHIFFPGDLGGQACDRILLDVVRPFVEEQCRSESIQRFFFVRYSEHGPHVRLRMYGEGSVLERTVRPALRRHIDLVGNWQDPMNARSSPRQLELRWIPYLPEVGRYGGSEAIGLAEEAFFRSSEVVFRMLRKISGEPRAVRLGQTMLSMTVLYHVFCSDRDDAATLAADYGAGYLKALTSRDRTDVPWLNLFDNGFERQSKTIAMFVNNAWERLDANEPVTDTMDLYRHHLKAFRRNIEVLIPRGEVAMHSVVCSSWAQCLRMIIPSHIHMTNNRLGITISEESYLSHLLQKILDRNAMRDLALESF